MIAHPIEDRLRKLLAAYPVAAIRILREYYYEKLCSLAHNLVHLDEAAKSLVENTLLLVHDNYKKLEEYRGHTIRHYMVRVVRSNASAWYRWQGYNDHLSRDMVMQVRVH